MIKDTFIKELSEEILRKRFFLERMAIFDQQLEDRIIFLYPVDEKYKPKSKSRENRNYFLGVLENFKLCLMEVQEDKKKKIQLQTPVFSIDIRSFICEDILKVKITDFLGLKVEFYGNDDIPHVSLDVVYYTLEMGKEKDIERDYLCQTISFPLSQLFDSKLFFEYAFMQTHDRPEEMVQMVDETFPVVNSYTSQCGIRHINIGTLNENYKSIGVQVEELGNTIILKSWNPNKKMERKKIPGDIGNEQIIAVHSDENNIFVSCKNERIYRLDYDSNRYDVIRPGNNLCAISMLKIGDYLFAAMTNRSIYRIHLESQKMDFHILESAPIFLAPLGKDKMIVTNKQKHLLVFRVYNEIETDELAVYRDISRDWSKNKKIDIKNACREILHKETFEESQIVALEFAAYSWLEFYPDPLDVYTPLKALIYVINRHFCNKPDKGGIILGFIKNCQKWIFSDYEKYSLLLKEFYITSCDKYRSDFLRILQAHSKEIRKEIKNELEFLCWNGSSKKREIEENLLNLFGLFWLYKDSVYIEYVKTIPQCESTETEDDVNQVISYFRILDTSKYFQQIVVMESKKYYLYLLDKNFFEDEILPEKKLLALEKKSKIRKIQFTSEKDYLFYSDETQELKIFGLDAHKSNAAFVPVKVPLSDIAWDMDTISVSADGKIFELVVVGFKNSGFKIYLFDFERPGTLHLLHEEKLQNDWIRELDIIAIDEDLYLYEIALVGSKRKKMYCFAFRLVYKLNGNTFKVKPERLQVKKSTRSLYCVKFYLDDGGHRFIVVGSDEGDVYFLDDHLNLQWQQKLEDSIRKVKICCGIGEGIKEIIVGVGNDDIYFFSQDGFIRRVIHFGKPLHSIDTALLDLEKRKDHIIACIDNRLVVYEINQEFLETKITDSEVMKHKIENDDKNFHFSALDDETATLCESIRNRGFDTRSPVLIMGESLIYFYRWRSIESLIKQYEANSTRLLDYYKKDRNLFLQSLGNVIDNTNRNNYQAIGKIIGFISRELSDDEKIQWYILKFYQKVYQKYKGSNKAKFLTEMDRLIKDPGNKKIRSIYAQSPWLLESVAIVIADVLHIDENNILIIINDLLAKNMPNRVYDVLAHYFNHKPAFEYLFSLYCELDKTPLTAMKEKFTYFTNQLARKEEALIEAGIKYLKELSRFYKRILKALQIDTLAEMQHKDIDMDITQPLYELETCGFEIRPAFKVMFQTLQNLELKQIEEEKYLTKKIEQITEVKLLLAHLLEVSMNDAQVGNKLINLIAYNWNRILDKTLNEYRRTIKIELLFNERIDENVSLKSGFLSLENVGGTAAREVVAHAISDSLQPRTEPFFIGDIKPGPGNEARVLICDLLENPYQQTGKFKIKIKFNYMDAWKIKRKTELNFELDVIPFSKYFKKNKWEQYCKENPGLFDYSMYYPKKYQEASDEISKLISKGSGLLFLQDAEGEVRSSLLICLCLFWESNTDINSYYIPIDSHIRRISPKYLRFKTILHQTLEKIEGAKVENYDEIDQYLVKIKENFERSREVGVIFINHLDQLLPDSIVEFYDFMEKISQYAVLVAAVDRNVIRRLRVIHKIENVLNISTIYKEDQENLFKIRLGDDFNAVLPQNWWLLVGKHVYSTYLLCRILKTVAEKLKISECLERMWGYYFNEKIHKGNTDYYKNLWDTLSLNEQMIVFICAKEHTEIPIVDLNPGLFVGREPYLSNKKIPNYKIAPKKEREKGVKSNYLEENDILDDYDLNYLKRARVRIHIKNTKRGCFPVKLQNEETLLQKNQFSRIVLANFLAERGQLKKKLKELCTLGILREVEIEGGCFYCHKDYFFMTYLLRTFSSYHKLWEKGDLVNGYTLKNIQYALSLFNKEERNNFIKLLGFDEQRMKLLEKLNNHWEKFKLETSTTQDFYDFLKQIFYLETVRDYDKPQLFDHFCERFFRFRIQVVSKFENLILIIILDESAALTQLEIRLQEILNYYNVANGNTLIFMISRFDRLKLYMDIDKYDLNIVLMDENSLKKYIQAEKKELELLQQISHYLDLRILSPYRYKMGVVGDMFVGRKRELDTIFNKPNTDFAIFGERRIGKTSLLKQIIFQCKEKVQNAYIYPIFIDLYPVSTSEDFFKKLNNCLMYESFFNKSAKIKIRNIGDFESLLTHFLNSDNRIRLIFLFDEIDDLYSNCFVECPNCSAKQLVTTENYERIKDGFNCSFCEVITVPRNIKPKTEIKAVHDIFASFRSISQTYARCQFVFTGFKILYHLHKHHGTEFFNFTHPLDLGKLEYDDLKSLVVEPMKRLNIRFEYETEILEKLYEYSLNGIPWLIQLYCDRIIERLAEISEPMVTRRLIDEIAVEVKPDIDQTLKYTITTSRETGLLKLIHNYRQTYGSLLEEFRLEDLLEHQKLIDIKPDQLFKKAELDYYLDLLSRCFFLKKEPKKKEGDTNPQSYFRLSLASNIFDSFFENSTEES